MVLYGIFCKEVGGAVCESNTRLSPMPCFFKNVTSENVAREKLFINY